MNPSQKRYFPGRAPAFDEDSESDAESGERDSKTKEHALLLKASQRKKFVARVISASQSTPESRTFGSASGFEPLNPACDEKESQDAVTGVQQTKKSSTGDRDIREEASIESSSSSTESDTSELEEHVDGEDESYSFTSFRPQFVKQKIEDEECDIRLRSEKEEMRFRQRRNEARKLVTDVLNEEDRRLDGKRAEMEMPDDGDYEEDQEAEYALWRVREVLRIRKEREAQKAWAGRTELSIERAVKHKRSLSSNNETGASNLVAKQIQTLE